MVLSNLFGRKRKYTFTGETCVYKKHTLRRIKRLSDGVVGGWIETEYNLSQEGDCWVGDDAKVFDQARVRDDAKVFDRACVFGCARIAGNAYVLGDSNVNESAQVYEMATIYGNAIVTGEANVLGHSRVHDYAVVTENALIDAKAIICGGAVIGHRTRIVQSITVCGGIWKHNTPLYIQGSRHPIYQSSDSIVSIGCERYSLAHWFKYFEEIVTRNGYNEDEIVEYKQYLKWFSERMSYQQTKEHANEGK